MARKTKQEAQETRHSILDAAERLFQRQGVSRTSLQQIAEEAGLTRGAIYWHFKDKAELFEAMMDRATMPLEEGMNMQPQATDQPLTLAELRWGLINILHCTVHNERTRRVFDIAIKKVEYTGELQSLQDRKLSAMRRWREQNRAAFVQAVKRGELPATLNTEVAAVALVALVDGLLHQWVVDQEGFDLMAVGQTAIEGFLTSMARGTVPGLLPPLSEAERARLGLAGACARQQIHPEAP
ncbi:TetR family transcriptional regulator [Roseateles sp. DAIF2]|uniref:TetR family transcriptional regulator n=1 Tax=Roseateles sp. DAIF2 TaxID=2714952 RepID=UPI0018A314C4|nr:TetR family transcriptional regulator [Roseateles sp. DAIF2]QPF75610.1 TetR family transcriptional regulator [Roseateles sp. DAIF2]